MRRKFLVTAAAVAIAAGAMLSSVSAAQTPPMGGGYTNVIPIPVVDPVTKAIAGALFKPEGAGPFPAVIYVADCNGVSPPWAVARQKHLVDHNLTKGVATLIVDSNTARHEENGWCDRNTVFLMYVRQAEDAFAARSVLAAMPEIDAKRIFLQGYGAGANSATLAAGSTFASGHPADAKFAGVVAYYPYCVDDMKHGSTTPTLLLVGEKDDFAPAKLCEVGKGAPNLEFVFYPGATHYFELPGVGDFQGHHMAYDEKAAKDAEARADAFIAAHMTGPATQ